MNYIEALWLILPAGFANMSPVLGEKIFPDWNMPIDLRRTWKGSEIFGSHKTYRGLISGIIAGFLVFFLQQKAYELSSSVRSFSLIDYAALPTAFGAWLGLTALLGDLVKSFFKRRLAIAPGRPWIPFDEMDWIAGALVGILILFVPSWNLIWCSFVVGAGLHFLIRGLAYLLHFVSSPL